MFGLRSHFISRALAVLALSWSATAAVAAKIDFSPEQLQSPHVKADPKAIAALPPGFKFARDGVFTVAIAPFGPPIATYATDARTPVGADPDIANLIAESLGLKLELDPVAWADWPLGLASGKYDASPM
jgi:polar amino acid transport system substrate-binding protein